MARKTFLYFAFGSNLLTERIHISNPSAVFRSIAKLKDHKLDFNYYSQVGMILVMNQTRNCIFILEMARSSGYHYPYPRYPCVGRAVGTEHGAHGDPGPAGECAYCLQQEDGGGKLKQYSKCSTNTSA